MTPQKYCEIKVKQSGSSFYSSFLFLSSLQRQAMTALYAFCREIDDIVDTSNDASIALTKLNWWKSEVENIYIQKASHPIAIALSECLKIYTFKKQYFLEIIQGMQMDLNHQGFETYKELENYCYHAASTVGLLTIEITGYHSNNNEKMKEYAIHLGKSLQLINILRDVKEDLELGRIYISRQQMQQFSVTPQMLKEKICPQTKALFSDMSEKALHHYQLALSLLPKEDRYSQRVGLIMADIYLAILDKIVKQGYPVLEYRVRINPLKKLWLAWSCVRREFKLESRRS